ncbi:MAG TPA: glycosyltransferase family 2 protein [Spirochaetota bacterium]|nr:glycosyltransferase family 2 protein [Spirochaetota bacterium]
MNYNEQRKYMNYYSREIGVVIPCYNVSQHITDVVKSIPDIVGHIILVNDMSSDNTSDIINNLAASDERLLCVEHSENKGVGGAVMTGMKKAIELGCDLILKMDGDGQMDARYLPQLLNPLVQSDFHFAKGNRFNDFRALRQMPFIRRAGNLFLSFMVKAASGYWSVFDPTNGFFCIKREILEKIDFDRLEKRYFFESALLIELYYTGAKIYDVPIPALYGNEKSNLSVINALFTFPVKLIKAFARRILLKYFIYDFNIFSIYILIGSPLLSFGVVFGIVKWIEYGMAGIPAPTGTVMLATLSVILGVQLLLSVIQHDMTSRNPFSIELPPNQ